MKKIAHCCGLCLYRFREEGWADAQINAKPQIQSVQGEDEEEETDSDGYDNWNFYNDENEGKNNFDSVPRDQIV